MTFVCPYILFPEKGVCVGEEVEGGDDEINEVARTPASDVDPIKCPCAVMIKQGPDASSSTIFVGFAPEIHFTKGQRQTTADSRLSSLLWLALAVVEEDEAGDEEEDFSFSCCVSINSLLVYKWSLKSSYPVHAC